MKLNLKTTGLVLEGGGMRGVFTSGVLDAFMKHDVHFPYTVAVSAGACNGMSYMSRQPRRARISNIDYLARYQYIGIRHLVTQGCIFDRKLLYDKFPNQLLPFDFDTYLSMPMVSRWLLPIVLRARLCIFPRIMTGSVHWMLCVLLAVCHCEQDSGSGWHSDVGWWYCGQYSGTARH